ncbi:MAG: triphosphoribosyl-dephospho-CoA synthase [Proteobacteria bacterium]|nr:triphosphoribosyl-dephospho-CoA synthase [Pseudomonadota bacterium]
MTPAAAFLQACALDVAVRKPGNVSQASPGHGMTAADFLASSEAAAPALVQAGSVGARIEAAVAATWQRVGCNTNLGIVLLCAPLAMAVQQAARPDRPALRAALQQVLGSLTVADAEAAFRAIRLANPGGLGEAPEGDVREAPAMTLRDAMALAAGRDRIARFYAEGGAELWEVGLAARDAVAAPLASTQTVQAIYLAWLASAPDAHIVRKHGLAVAQTVMQQAAPWWARARAGAVPDDDPAFAAWDAALKAARINPGTSADLTVATLMAAGCLEAGANPEP